MVVAGVAGGTALKAVQCFKRCVVAGGVALQAVRSCRPYGVAGRATLQALKALKALQAMRRCSRRRPLVEDDLRASNCCGS